MKCNFPVEINGLTTIVIDNVCYLRKEDRNWIRTSDGKQILDAHMWQRVKRMMNKERLIHEEIYAPIAGKMHTVGNFVPCYRAWVNTTTLNIEKLYYD